MSKTFKRDNYQIDSDFDVERFPTEIIDWQRKRRETLDRQEYRQQPQPSVDDLYLFSELKF